MLGSANLERHRTVTVGPAWVWCEVHGRSAAPAETASGVGVTDLGWELELACVGGVRMSGVRTRVVEICDNWTVQGV